VTTVLAWPAAVAIAGWIFAGGGMGLMYPRLSVMTLALSTKDTEGFLSQISTVEKVNENQNSVLQDYQQEQATLADLEHSTQTDLAALGEQEKQLKELRASSDANI